MTRTTAREIAIHLSFELGFTHESAQEMLDRVLTKEAFASRAEEEPIYAEFPSQKQLDYIRTLVNGVGEHGYELDQYIEKYARGWKFARLPRTATAIMRVAMYEILYMPEIPNSAAINEAVEISKGYEDPEVVSFINGILGSFVRSECPDFVPQSENTPVEQSTDEGEA
jgi:N utilization substance protein B